MLRLTFLLIASALFLAAAPAPAEIRIAGLDPKDYLKPVRRSPQPLNLRPLETKQKKSGTASKPRRLRSRGGIRFGFKRGSQPTIGYSSSRAGGVRFNAHRNFGRNGR